MNAKNNVNKIGKIGRQEVYTLKDKGLTDVQVELVRAIATALKDCDNVYFELCNEPYFAGVTPEWTAHMVKAITEAEKDFPARHLIAQNIANRSAKVHDPNPHVSILNFHYATPPTTVAENSWEFRHYHARMYATRTIPGVRARPSRAPKRAFT